MHAKKTDIKLLVTGASGFLGWNLCAVAVHRYRVFGVCNTHPCSVAGVIVHQADLCNEDEVNRLFLEIDPDVVIHTAAAADPNYCQENPEKSYRINVVASATLARHCAQKNIPFVFTSTDLVFDGTDAPYAEDAQTCPISLYGRQKAEAEQQILSICPTATVCRMPLMYGDAPPHAKSFIHPMIDAIVLQKEMKLFTDEFRTPCCAVDTAAGLLLAAQKGVTGLLHLGGPECLSRFDMGMQLGNALEKAPLITPSKQSEVTMPAPRPADVSLDSTKARALGFAPATMAIRLPQLAIIQRNKNTTI